MEESSGSGIGGSRYNLRSKTKKKKNSPPQDLESSPAPKRAKEVEAVSGKVADLIARYRNGNRDRLRQAPPRREPSEQSKALSKKRCRDCVETALKFLNKSKKAQKVGEYEVVEVMDVFSITIGMKGFFSHTCFTAKPKNYPEAEPKSFFAELKFLYPGPYKCIKCCMLGPLDHGYHGCYSCKKSGLPIHHPLSGFHNGFPPHTL